MFNLSDRNYQKPDKTAGHPCHKEDRKNKRSAKFYLRQAASQVSDHDRGVSFGHAAIFLKKSQNWKEAIDCFLLELETVKDDNKRASIISIHIAACHAQVGEPQEAVKYFHQADQLAGQDEQQKQRIKDAVKKHLPKLFHIIYPDLVTQPSTFVVGTGVNSRFGL